MQRTSRLALLLAPLLLVGAGCFSVSTNANVSTNGNPPPTEPPAVNQPVSNDGNGAMDIRIAGNAIIVGEQRPAATLKVEEAAVDKPSFVVVREGNYATGTVIGKSDLLQPGSNQGLVISLSRASVDGEQLFLTAYVDDGNGTYDAADTTILADWQGNPLSTSVMINAKASEEPLLPRI